jgi:hypothetical protein
MKINLDSFIAVRNFRSHRKCTFIIPAGFEPAAPVFERSKTVHKPKTTVFRDVAPWSTVEIEQSLRGAYCLHNTGTTRRSTPHSV